MLGRKGAVQIDARIPADAPLLEGTELRFDGDLAVNLRATYAGTGEIVVRGSLTGALLHECRRCLNPVGGTLNEEVTMVFAPSASEGSVEDGDVRLFDDHAAELDLSVSVREELVLAVDLFVVCDPECRGLCPQCGVNRNTETCACTVDESDPRWDALRALKEK